jgi:hypothetical protein
MLAEDAVGTDHHHQQQQREHAKDRDVAIPVDRRDVVDDSDEDAAEERAV